MLVDDIVTRGATLLGAANLGKGFADMAADLILDKYGRVKVIGSKLSFYTDIDHLPFEILDAISERLEKEADNRILARIKDKIKRTKSVNINSWYGDTETIF